MSADIAVIGRQRQYVLDALAADFTLHGVWDADDLVAALRPIADRIRCVVSNPMAGLSAELVEELPNLELWSQGGVGLERVDLALARRRDIVVTTTPVLYEDVADLAVLLALTASRRAVEGDRMIRAGRWQRAMPQGRRMSLKRAGILGMGRIGRMLAPRLEAFGMDIGYYDPRPVPNAGYRTYPSATELAQASDFLFLCASGQPGERHIVGADLLDALGADGVFVNVARGWLVDEVALIKALRDGTIRAAGLDVFDNEPHVPRELQELDNVVMTPHIGSNTTESQRAMDDCLIENVRSWFAGTGAVTPVDR